MAGTLGHPPALIRCQTVHGLTFRLDPISVMDQEVIRYGYYEPHIVDIILRSLPPNGVFWDVGANIGLHAITVAKLRPDVQVIAFEPVPTVHARLLMNSHSNGVSINSFSIALGPKTGFSNMSIRLTGNTGIASLKPWPGGTYEASITVPTERGDRLVKKGIVPAPSVVKIDVEGFELEALNGLSQTLANREIEVIVFESAPTSLKPIRALLEGFGYSVAGLQEDDRNYVARLT